MSASYMCLVLGVTACGIMAIRATRLLAASLWLAGLSAILATFFYMMGAPEIAVIELSVGAGLVTVLFVFTIGIAEDTEDAGESRGTLIPRPVAMILGALVFLLLGWLTLPLVDIEAPAFEPVFTSLLWEGRDLDVLAQVVLIFAGVLGILELLAQVATREEKLQVPPAQEPEVGSRPCSGIERKEAQL
jgi:NADH:ubiquinone oxidoreductase subunit 6 (subunit J)